MSIILFEDHTFAALKPLTWSVPAFELRCGLFNLRERVKLVAPEDSGVLFCRGVLRPLLTDPQWTSSPQIPETRTLWVGGRLIPRTALLATLVAQREQDWVLHDDQGLLAASLSVEIGRDLAESWRAWEADAWAGAAWHTGKVLDGLEAPDLGEWSGPCGLDGSWSLVPATSAVMAEDLALLGENPIERHPFGLFPAGEGTWRAAGNLRRIGPDATPDGVIVTGTGGLYLGSGGVELAPGTQLDTTDGPVILDSGVRVMPHSYLAGPLYLGRDSIVKPGARIFGETSCGIGNRLAGEIGESTFGDFVNKQHDGFIGHAVLGSWVNLGAGTTCSDLKNNYGPVRVDLGDGQRDTGLRFVGVLIGDHTKTAIGSLFNTGTTVGFGCNVFGAGVPPKFVGNFRWGGQAGAALTDEAKAMQTAETVLGRRGCLWTPAHAELFRLLHQLETS